MTTDQPYILDETEDFAIVYKPPKMHSAPLEQKSGQTLHEWYTVKFPSVSIMHRLDFETHGLILFAKNEKSYGFFKSLQDCGGFIKEYSAVCKNSLNATSDISAVEENETPDFPPPPVFASHRLSPEKPLIIESFFRPFGPGRKLVRPVIIDDKKHKEVAKDKDGFYKTEIINADSNTFTVRIRRGFRHQIRCHLFWIGCPILGDPLYSSAELNEHEQSLALRSHALYFTNPSNGKHCEYRIDPLGS